MSRIAKIDRNTKETKISVIVNLDGTGNYKIKSGIGFLDHNSHTYIHIIYIYYIICNILNKY